jgi:AraC-like DNA-binding protein
MGAPLLFYYFTRNKHISNLIRLLASDKLFHTGTSAFNKTRARVLHALKHKFATDEFVENSGAAADVASRQPLAHKQQTDTYDVADNKYHPHKNSRFSLAEETSKEYVAKVEKYFGEKKAYLDPELSMAKAAKDLDIPLHHLSFVLNGKLGCNFSDYINRHRIEAVKNKLRTQPNLKIESIGYECGFNSKATYNRVFKKHCHQSPSEYQKSVSGNS